MRARYFDEEDKICPYCLKPKGRMDLNNSPYHAVCSSHVTVIRRRAIGKVSYAKKVGLIPLIDSGTKCVDCGNPAHGYDHRYYSKPLDVEPVCRSCNQKRGRALDLHQFYLAQLGESEGNNRLPEQKCKP